MIKTILVLAGIAAAMVLLGNYQPNRTNYTAQMWPEQAWPERVLPLEGLIVHSLSEKSDDRCNTPIERSYLNEHWNYSCPIDPIR